MSERVREREGDWEGVGQRKGVGECGRVSVGE